MNSIRNGLGDAVREWDVTEGLVKADMVNVPDEVISETRERLSEREVLREEHLEKSEQREWLTADSPERVEKRLKRLGTTKEDVDPLLLERIFGENDLVDMSFLEMGLWVARSVGRILYRTAAGNFTAEGTGFMVSPRLLLTNNHVVSSPESASRFLVEFNYQIGLDGNLLPSLRFDLQPDTFFVTDKDLDYCLVAVSPNAIDGSALEAFGWNRLIEEEGKVVTLEFVNLIQHPDGEPKKLALRENRVLDVLKNFLHYTADTATGSSGSPVFNSQWEVVALHHAGAQRRDGRGNILTKRGEIWSPGMLEQEIDWIANEGTRISRIVQHLKQQPLDTDVQRQLREEMFEAVPPSPV